MAFLPSRRVVLAGLVLALATSIPAAAQTPPALSLDEAVRLAIDQSRRVAIARLGVDKAGDDTTALATRRLPNFDLTTQTGTLLASVNLVFPTGAFGTFPTTGPIPSQETSVKTSPRFVTSLSARVSQPLTRLWTVDWGMRALRVGEDIAREQVRVEEGAVRNDVRRLYYGILQAESGLRANADALALYEELDRLMTDYLAREVVLPAEAMAVQASLARHRQVTTSLQHTLDTLHEQINLRIGRDLMTPFSVVPVAGATEAPGDLEGLERLALEQRPEIQSARLKVQQAQYDLERARSELIPDVSAVFSYLGFYNFEVLPRNIASVGVYVTWEPFDWGRRRAEQASKQKTITQATLGVRETEDSVLVDVRQQYRRVQDARALLDVTDLELRTARERLRVATDRFRADASLRREVLEAQAAAAAADQTYRQALAEFWTARADLDKATGGAP